MLPFMQPQSPEQPEKGNRAAVVTIFVLALLAVLFVALIRGAAMMSQPIILVFFVLAAVLPALYLLTRSQSEKSKRAGQDMYRMIDQLVDDLDDDEIAYLQRRLEDHESRQKAVLSEDMVDLINLRDLDRRAGKRE